MTLGEFSLIHKYFSSPAVTRADVSLGVGDDCALLNVPVGKQLAISMDTLVEGRHFLKETDPWRLGWKVLAVNLSDLAAMGAEPAWATLSVTLPDIDESWLVVFMQGFSELARIHNVQLVGGDTTRGPLAFTVQVHGFVDPETVMLREGASPGDSIYVTGSLGGAGAALKLLIDGADEIPDELRELLEKPEPRVEQGKQLVSLASACIDISDGLAGDLQHILDASGCGAAVELESIPLSSATRSYMQAHNEWQLPLVAGDDYELLFTVSPDKTAELERLLPDIGCDVTRIGTIDIQAGLRFVDGNGALREPGHAFDHFIDND